MVNFSSNWQNSLNQKLVNRLSRPLRQPGMMKMAMSQRIINRCDRFLNRFPLLNQQMQRWGNNITFSFDDVPIVYAQPISLAQERGIESSDQNVQPTVAENNPSVSLIQRKVDSAQTLPVQNENRTDLPSSNFLNETTTFLPSDTQVIESSTESTASANPSQINSNLRSHPDEITITNQTASVNPSKTNSNPRSHPEKVTKINQTASAEEEIPLVSPQAIPEELESTEKLPLQAKFSDSQTTSAHPSQIDSDSRSQPDEVTIINQTTTANAEIPVVSSQAIPNEEMSLVQEYISTAQQPLPIIQAKQQNSSQSRLSLPVVNPSNRLVTIKQMQQHNYEPEKSTSIKDKKSKVEFPVQEFPIVTVQPLTYPINFNKAGVRNKPNYQNQLFNISQSQINQNNIPKNIASLPIVPVPSQINSSSPTQALPLPLANNNLVSNSISQKPNLSNQNSIGSTTVAASSPRIFASSSPPTQTFVSAMESQPKIDLDAITSQVEKKIMRRLVIESERRGKIR